MYGDSNLSCCSFYISQLPLPPCFFLHIYPLKQLGSARDNVGMPAVTIYNVASTSPYGICLSSIGSALD